MLSQWPSSRSGNSMESPRAFPICKWIFTMASPRPLLAVFTIELSTKLPRASFPPIHGSDHTTNMVGVVSQDYKPLQCTTMVRASTH